VELVMWIAIGIVAVLGFIVLVPVLVVGTWYVVITVIMGLADGAIWLLDKGWRTIRGRKSRAEVQTKPQQMTVSMEFQTESRVTS